MTANPLVDVHPGELYGYALQLDSPCVNTGSPELQYKDEERIPNINRKVLRNKTLSRRRINNRRNN